MRRLQNATKNLCVFLSGKRNHVPTLRGLVENLIFEADWEARRASMPTQGNDKWVPDTQKSDSGEAVVEATRKQMKLGRVSHDVYGVVAREVRAHFGLELPAYMNGSQEEAA